MKMFRFLVVFLLFWSSYAFSSDVFLSYGDKQRIYNPLDFGDLLYNGKDYDGWKVETYAYIDWDHHGLSLVMNYEDSLSYNNLPVGSIEIDKKDFDAVVKESNACRSSFSGHRVLIQGVFIYIEKEKRKEADPKSKSITTYRAQPQGQISNINYIEVIFKDKSDLFPGCTKVKI